MSFDSKLEKPAIEGLKQVLLANFQISQIRDLGPIPISGHYTPDAYFSLKIGDEEVFLIAEVKQHVDNYHQIKRFIEVSESFEGLAILVAVSISNSIKKNLSELGIGFLELDQDFFFPLRRTQGLHSKTLSSEGVRTTGFRTETALKILFYLESFPESRLFPQRKIAQDLGVSVGAVNTNLGQLEELGLLQRTSDKGLQMKNPRKAFEYWTQSYRSGARNKLMMGRFSPIDPDFFKTWQDLKVEQTYWGGEPAVAKLKGYLTPGFFTLYTYETRLPVLLKNLRLKKDPHGKIEILQAFWPEALNHAALQTVTPFLILSDLMGSGIDRNQEAAQDFAEADVGLRSFL